MSEEPRSGGRRSNAPLVIIFVVVGVVVLLALGYGFMAGSGPMPGMDH